MLLNFNGKEFWTTLTENSMYNLLLVFGIASELGFEQMKFYRQSAN
jgi:UDP-N-acetylmuramoyl-L-alanyl-D-glutamate--2,6-diaminopimelate ligase